MNAKAQAKNQTNSMAGVQQSRPDGDNTKQQLIDMGYDLDVLDQDNPLNARLMAHKSDGDNPVNDWHADGCLIYNGYDQFIGKITNIRNAGLVAAAPALLTALHELLDQVLAIGGNGYAQQIANARAAIAKAKGE